MKFQITLRETADQDLIEWYRETPYGDRGHTIREALRLYIKSGDKPNKPLRNNAHSNALKNLEL